MTRSGQLRRLARPASCTASVFMMSVLTLQAAHAQAGRPDTRQMTCAQAQALVQQRGSVVMTTGPTTFDKFVANASYCRPQTNSVRAKYAPTKDNPKCAVGNRCFQNRDRR
ncbi:MAG: hypothetical protein K5905_14320 [Roseibium sp.]|uniref:hypothetical protein n=1 Tax=Roseibium sp. TaxID=1936156 RepID=UPI00260279BC|nr:hypothetical protein [Roseibium sp.]MCV0426640.1 hypothetical protein [Roseibium sp.]